jgi:hypothetical protein
MKHNRFCVTARPTNETRLTVRLRLKEKSHSSQSKRTNSF